MQQSRKQKKIRATQICSKPVVAADIVSSNSINMQLGGRGGGGGTQPRKKSCDYFFLFKFLLINVVCRIPPNFINGVLLLYMDIFFLKVPLWVFKMF